jgi:hypothetical protein
MSVIPEIRRIGSKRRVNIPNSIAREYDDGQAFAPEVDDTDIVLTPVDDESGNTMSPKNRVRLPEHIVEQYHPDTRFAVVSDSGCVIFRPTSEIEIRL